MSLHQQYVETFLSPFSTQIDWKSLTSIILFITIHIKMSWKVCWFVSVFHTERNLTLAVDHSKLLLQFLLKLTKLN